MPLVTRVIDGDTFETQELEAPVRLADVNAPELGTPRGEKAKEALKQRIEGHVVDVDQVARDTYGRIVAEVSLVGLSVNAYMRQVIAGL